MSKLHDKFPVPATPVIGGSVYVTDATGATDGRALISSILALYTLVPSQVVASLSGATITSATVASGDKVLIQDVSNSDALRTVTAQTIADLFSVIDSPLLQGNNSAYHLARANHTGTQVSETITADASIKSTGAYSLVAGDKGKVIEIDNNLTIPAGLGANFYCSIFLNNAAAKTITTAGLTVRGTPGTSISAYGLVSVYAIAADTFYIKGETE